MKRAPILSSRKSSSYPGDLIVMVRCPHCGEKHQHGASSDHSDEPSHRYSHCGDPLPSSCDEGYEIFWPEDEEVKHGV